MKIAITGGTGFVGRALARAWITRGHTVSLVARGTDRSDAAIRLKTGAKFHACALDDLHSLAAAFADCRAVIHCAGINRELNGETFQKVHVEGTIHVVQAAKQAGVRKLVLTSFLRARPNCHSGYHESKWVAEEIVRNSGLDYTVFKAGVIYGPGDHMLDHLSHAFHTFPVFGFVGFRDQQIRPVAIEDMVRLLAASAEGEALSRRTVAVLGPETLTLRQAVRRVAHVVGRNPVMVPMPVWFHRLFAALTERVMVVPMVSVAQIRMLHEGLAEPLPGCDLPPGSLVPRRTFSEAQIRKGLPPARRYDTQDLIFCRRLRQGGAT